MACDHTEPFAYTPPATRGPFSLGVPRQLTFNAGDDRFPSVQGGLVAYSRRLPNREDGDWCVAVLPDTGGEILHELCPPGESDSLVDAWRYPALSPDGGQVVFWKERGLVANRVPATRDLVVAPLTQRDSLTVVLSAPYLLPDGSRANAVRQMTWPAAKTVRFVAGNEIVDLFTSDTVFTPMSVVDVDVTTGVITPLPGTLDVGTYALSDDGGIWFSRPGGKVVLHLAPGSAAPDTVVKSSLVIDQLANAGGVPVAIAEYLTQTGAYPILGTLVVGDSIFRQLWNGTPPLSVSASPVSGVIVLQAPRVGSGLPVGSNLWMVSAR